MAAVAKHKDSAEDAFFLGLMQSDVSGVRHFLRQYHLVLGDETERRALATEWRDLALHDCFDCFDDPIIHDDFDIKFPVLHKRQQHWVDPYLTDTLNNEAEFSIRRRIHETSLTTTGMDDRMWWDTLIGLLREIGRLFGEKERAASKAARDAAVFGPANKPAAVAASDWSRTYGQCNAVCVAIVKDLYPILSDEAMASAPRVRKDLKEGAGLVKQDRALAQSWLDELKKNTGSYRREVTLGELMEASAKVQLAYELKPEDTVEKVPLRSRLDLAFSNVPAVELQAELRSALPLGVLAMKVASCDGTGPECAAVNPHLKLLLAVLLSPRPSAAAVTKALAPVGVSATATVVGVFELARAGRSKAPVSEVNFIVRYLALEAAPIMADLDRTAFDALLASADAGRLAGLSAFLLRRKQVSAATKAVPFFKANGQILKGNALAALSTFGENALLVLEYLGGYEDDRCLSGELLAGSLGFGPSAGSAGAMFVLSRMAMGPAQRKAIGCTSGGDGGKVAPLPRHGVRGFVSVLQKPERGAAEAAFTT